MTIEKSRFNSEAAPQSSVNQGEYSTNDFAAIVPVIAGRIGGREANIVSARALRKALGVGRDFTTWIKGRISQYGFAAGVDYITVENLSSPVSGSAKFRQQIEHDYLLSLDMAKEVAMVERNEQGRAVRRAHLAVAVVVLLLACALVAAHGHPAGVDDDPSPVGLMADHRGQDGESEFVEATDADVMHDQIEENIDACANFRHAIEMLRCQCRGGRSDTDPRANNACLTDMRCGAHAAGSFLLGHRHQSGDGLDGLPVVLPRRG